MVRSLIKLPLAAALPVSCCTSEVKKMNEGPVPVCTTVAQCDARDGTRVEVIGVYTVHNLPPRRKLDDDSPRPVLLMLGDEQGPLLEPFWHEQAVRPAEEIARFVGKKVRVRGTYYREQPKHPSGKPMGTLGGPCVHPVEAMALAD